MKNYLRVQNCRWVATLKTTVWKTAESDRPLLKFVLKALRFAATLRLNFAGHHHTACSTAPVADQHNSACAGLHCCPVLSNRYVLRAEPNLVFSEVEVRRGVLCKDSISLHVQALSNILCPVNPFEGNIISRSSLQKYFGVTVTFACCKFGNGFK